MLPVELYFMAFQPGQSKDHVSVAQVRDKQVDMLRMLILSQAETDEASNLVTL